MEYVIIELPKKVVAGIIKKIPIQTPSMSLWGEFYTNTISKIEGQYNTKAYGLYYDFQETGCTTMVACEVQCEEEQDIPIVRYTIPAGRYAKFCIKGEVHQVVPMFWSKINEIGLERSYQCDFEVFPSKDTEDIDIEIYISIM